MSAGRRAGRKPGREALLLRSAALVVRAQEGAEVAIAEHVHFGARSHSVMMRAGAERRHRVSGEIEYRLYSLARAAGRSANAAHVSDSEELEQIPVVGLGPWQTFDVGLGGRARGLNDCHECGFGRTTVEVLEADGPLRSAEEVQAL